MKDMKNIKTVIFDLDGTLLDTIEDLTDSVNYVCRVFGYPEYTVETIKTFVGNGIRNLLERAVPGGRENADYERIYELFCSYYGQNCRNKTRPYDGIMELLSVLKQQGCKLAIVSNKNHDAVVALNEEFFGEYISVAVGQSDATKKKPAPDTVFAAMKALHATEESTVYIGDSEVDKQTADNAGLSCILVSWGFRERKELMKLDTFGLADTPQQILEFIHNTGSLQNGDSCEKK